MNSNEILAYTIDTAKSYSYTVKAKLANSMLTDGITTKKKSEADKKIYVLGVNDEAKIVYCLKKDHSLVKYIEQYEFKKNYKYSIFYKIPSELEIDKLIEKLLKNNDIVTYNIDGSFEDLYPRIMRPSLHIIEENYYLKFNTALSGIDSKGYQRKKRNTAVFKIFKQYGILEIRFDSIENLYDYDKSTYIKELISWAKKFISEQLEAIDFEDEIEYIIKNGKNDNVITSFKSMKMSNGTEATVGIGNSGNYVLPFIDEMKVLLKTYDAELDNAPNFKTEFENYIFDREEKSEYPCVTLLFANERYEVKFTKDYDGMGIYLIQHFSSNLQSNLDEGRMNHVTEYIINIGKHIKEI